MTRPCLLIVDDEPMNLEILHEALTDAGYETVSATNGEEALAALQAEPDRFHAVLLDRMMPGINGIEVLQRMKIDNRLRLIPVILQTARAGTEDIREGLQAGAFYYLCKPFDDQTMLAVVRTAVDDYLRFLSVRAQQTRTAQTVGLATSLAFEIRTPDEARDVSSLLASALPNASGIGIGLMELLLNGIEHGNLGISYKDKGRLLADDAWTSEIERRLALPENADKRVRLRVERTGAEITFSVEDDGAGFDWTPYLDFCPSRAFDSHGRGIAMARALSFASVEYRGRGNEVVARLLLPPSTAAGEALPTAEAA
jgi:CheY-like chemotaxis protein